ncbi:hypothetical protein [Pseudonocardia ammonioxydans]|uniref:hypothetical protein n=1 Tax=Pseudonocardia ammonioxydans TaxID=260086 RepID=UPI0011600B67|nr:hypothetical protein [Pseudonocardia ammonioxydans]
MSAGRTPERGRPGRWSRAVVWLPGLAVALGAAVATAHGLFEVAVAARVPAGIAWIYPLITDGLALVAYAATARLQGSAARYAWTVVVVSAGLSGLAQAVYLASDAVALGDGLAVSPALRFGVGAWPAVAAAVVAHLLYLLAADRPGAGDCDRTAGRVRVVGGVRSDARTASDTQVGLDAGHSPWAVLDGPVIPPPEPPVSDRPDAAGPVSGAPRPSRTTDTTGASSATETPARDRARDAAQRHRFLHGALPTVRELQALAEVGRGTAADALKQLRETPQPASTGLHLVTDDPETRTQR